MVKYLYYIWYYDVVCKMYTSLRYIVIMKCMIKFIWNVWYTWYCM